MPNCSKSPKTLIWLRRMSDCQFLVNRFRFINEQNQVFQNEVTFWNSTQNILISCLEKLYKCNREDPICIISLSIRSHLSVIPQRTTNNRSQCHHSHTRIQSTKSWSSRKKHWTVRATCKWRRHSSHRRSTSRRSQPRVRTRSMKRHSNSSMIDICRYCKKTKMLK